jgi:ketosteroid isomerase-like protein
MAGTVGDGDVHGHVVNVDGDGDVAEVLAAFDDYERALRANDVEALDAAFEDSTEVLRFGIADMQHGRAELEAWRATADPVSPHRRITGRWARALAPGVVAVDITFANGDQPLIGRQSQTWVRVAGGWRIVRAHVSVIHERDDTAVI